MTDHGSPATALGRGLCGLLLVPLLGCTAGSGALEERTVSVERELEETRRELAAVQRELDALRAELDGPRSEAPPPTPEAAGACTALFVVGDNELLNDSDEEIVGRLGHLGWATELASGDAVTPAMAAAAGLVLISKTVDSGDVDRELAMTEVGIITWEDNLQPDFLGVDGTQSHYTKGVFDVEDTDDHPLAAGFDDREDVIVYEPGDLEGVTDLSWGEPDRDNPDAVVVAANEFNSNDVHIYGYEAGATLDDGRTAAGRRVFFFLYDDSFVHLTDDGVAFFDAAVRWTSGVPESDCEADRG